MNVIFESFLVGIFSTTIASFLYLLQCKKNVYLFFFLTGFLKHILGYYLGFQNFYCNQGNACDFSDKKTDADKNIVYKAKYMDSFSIVFESGMEGWVFISLGMMFSKVWKKREIIVCFFIGFTLHMLAELFGIHKSYCKSRCEKINMVNPV